MRTLIVKSPLESVERLGAIREEPVLINRYPGFANGIVIKDGVATIIFDCADEVAEQILHDEDMIV